MHVTITCTFLEVYLTLLCRLQTHHQHHHRHHTLERHHHFILFVCLLTPRSSHVISVTQAQARLSSAVKKRERLRVLCIPYTIGEQ